TALLDEQTLKQIRRADRAAVGDRESQVRDAGFEVVQEAGNRSVVLAAIIGNDPGRELARNGTAWRLIDRLRANLELRRDILRQFGRQVPHAMRKAPRRLKIIPNAFGERAVL